MRHAVSIKELRVVPDHAREIRTSTGNSRRCPRRSDADTAGSFAFSGAPAVRDSTVASKLRAGGAVILGKTNLCEWANFRSFFSISGWCGLGGQSHQPLCASIAIPCGSSSGSGAAVSANFCRRMRSAPRLTAASSVPPMPERCRRHQADRRPDQSCRRRTDLSHAGHHRSTCAHRRRCGGGPDRHRQPDVRWPRRGHRRCPARPSRPRNPAVAALGLHPVRRSQRAARCSHRHDPSENRRRRYRTSSALFDRCAQFRRSRM